ncbi:MAG: DsbE family thiol:disulfide interchange protein [Pseudomonadota bacterium]
MTDETLPDAKPQEETRTTQRPRYVLAALPLLAFAALASVFAYLLLIDRDTSSIPSALIGKPVPEFTLPALDGLSASNVPVPGLETADLKGRIHVVNIFASWCAPCRAEHPVLLNLSKRDDIAVVGINYKDRPANALRFLGSLGNPYEKVGVDTRGRAAIDWGFYGIPETLLVAADGTVRHKIVGPIGPDKLARLEAEIEKLKTP